MISNDLGDISTSQRLEMVVAQAWFGPKRFGYGAGVRSWQGWVATGVYVAMMTATPRLAVHLLGRTPDGKHLALGLVALLTIGFLLLVWKKYEPRSE